MRIEARPATRADLKAVSGSTYPVTVRAWAWDIDGEVAAVAGYHLIGTRALVFSEIKADAPKFAIWREAKAVMEKITLPAICVAKEGSRRFLERLGWEYVSTDEDGEIFKCNF